MWTPWSMRQPSDISNELNLGSEAELVQQQKDRIARSTCRIFIFLMLLQWVGAIATAFILSPHTWNGTVHTIHIHVWAAIFLGGIITLVPVAMAFVYPTHAVTRHVIA